MSLTRSHPKPSACPGKWEGGREHPVLCFGVWGGGLPSSLLGGGGGPSSLLGVAGYPVLCQPSLAVNMPESLALALNLHTLGRPDGWVVPSSSLGKGGTQFFAVGVVGVVPSSSLGGGGGTQFFAGEGGFPVLRWGGGGDPVLRWRGGVPSSSLEGGTQFFAVGGEVPSSLLGNGGYPVLHRGREVPSSSLERGGGGGGYPVLCLPSLAVVLSVSLIALKTSRA